MKPLILMFFLMTLGCQPFEAIEPGREQLIQDVDFDTSIKIDKDCMISKSKNACLFLKSPVAYLGSKLPEKINSLSRLEEYQVASVAVATANSFLENETIQVFNTRGPRVRARNGSWKYSYNRDSETGFNQVSTYYWLSYAAAETRKRTGVFWAHRKSIKVMVNDEFAGWSASGKTIHIANGKNRPPTASDAGLMVYYLGLANLHFASEGKIEVLDSAKHQRCSLAKTALNNFGCCSSSRGCGRALASGSADYFVASLFPSKPTLGESWVNDPEGLNRCGQSRDLMIQKGLSSQVAYEACTNGRKGDVQVMGTVYASIWWAIRRQAQEVESDGHVNIDTLFQHHLKKLDGADDFTSAYRKILLTDQELYSSRYSELFRQEFQRRGISLL